MSNKKETTKINWIESKYQIADCLTRYGASLEKLLDTLALILSKAIESNRNRQYKFKFFF